MKFRRKTKLSVSLAAKESIGKSAPKPERIRGPVIGGSLENTQRTERDKLDPSGEGLACLLQEVDGGGPENEEAPGTQSAPPTLVDQAAEIGKQSGRPVDLIEDD